MSLEHLSSLPIYFPAPVRGGSHLALLCGTESSDPQKASIHGLF